MLYKQNHADIVMLQDVIFMCFVAGTKRTGFER